MRYFTLAVLLTTASCGSPTDGSADVSSLDAGWSDGAGPGFDATSGLGSDAGTPRVDAGGLDAARGDGANVADAGRGATARAIVANGGRLVDVRDPREYASRHIDGALNIPLDSLSDRLAELGPRDRWVVVYCQTGGRSAQAAALLRSEGFSQVFDLGPMSNW